MIDGMVRMTPHHFRTIQPANAGTANRRAPFALATTPSLAKDHLRFCAGSAGGLSNGATIDTIADDVFRENPRPDAE